MRAARLLAVVGLMAVISSAGAFAASSSRAQLTGKTAGTFQDITCEIYCDPMASEPNQITHPGTVSGCLADCEEICHARCVIEN